MLSTKELLRYNEAGYVGPYSLGDITPIVEEIETTTLCSKGPYHKSIFESRHQDSRIVYDLCTSPLIIQRVSSILGKNLVLWNSVFFNKEPGGYEIPWHQDQEFLLLQPVINAAAWIALDDTDEENGCLQIIPGSHTNDVPHLPRQNKNQFPARADIKYVRKDSAVNIKLRRGEFILMHPKVLHHSAANLSLRRRLGLVARFTVPGVMVAHNGLFKGHVVYCVLGEDSTGVNELGEPPSC